MRAATGAGAKSKLLVLRAVFMNVIMIAQESRLALVATNGVHVDNVLSDNEFYSATSWTTVPNPNVRPSQGS